MIECTDQYIYYKRRRIKKRRFLVFFAIILLVGIIIYQQNAVFKLIVNICEDNSYALSATSVNQAVALSLKEEVKYSELIGVEKNADGDIVLISANALKINVITRDIAQNTERILSEKLKNGVNVPILAFSGIAFLSGAGKQIKYRYISVSGVDCDISGEFKSVGINQTLHSVFVTVKTRINVEFLRSSKETEFFSKVLISEAVLVGKVPEIYLNGRL